MHHTALSTVDHALRTTERRSCAATRGRLRRRASLIAVGLITLLAGTVGWAAPALAAPQVTSPYPAVDVAAGQDVTVDLEITSSVTERVDLRVEAPKGWKTSLEADGFTVRSITAGPDEPTAVQLNITVPNDAKEGGHAVEVVAEAPSGTSTIPLDLRVTETATSAVSLSTEFSTLRGGSDDTFSYSVELANDAAEDATFQLTASGPDGWDVTASPSSKSQANTISVPAGGVATIDVEATPPAEAKAGKAEFVVRAQGSGRQAELKLTAELVGSVKVELTTSDERLNTSGTAGNATQKTFVVSNSGSAPLTGVELSATPPSDWQVEFEPKTIESVPAGESASVTATITPDSDAVAGDYIVSVKAASDQKEATADLRFTIETSLGWAIAAIVLIIVVVAALWFVFRRYGRR